MSVGAVVPNGGAVGTVAGCCDMQSGCFFQGLEVNTVTCTCTDGDQASQVLLVPLLSLHVVDEFYEFDKFYSVQFTYKMSIEM